MKHVTYNTAVLRHTGRTKESIHFTYLGAYTHTHTCSNAVKDIARASERDHIGLLAEHNIPFWFGRAVAWSFHMAKFSLLESRVLLTSFQIEFRRSVGYHSVVYIFSIDRCLSTSHKISRYQVRRATDQHKYARASKKKIRRVSNNQILCEYSNCLLVGDCCEQGKSVAQNIFNKVLYHIVCGFVSE